MAVAEDLTSTSYVFQGGLPQISASLAQSAPCIFVSYESHPVHVSCKCSTVWAKALPREWVGGLLQKHIPDSHWSTSGDVPSGVSTSDTLDGIEH